VGFVLHPKFDFTGSSPDGLVGSEGVLETKCPTTAKHLEYVIAGRVPEDYVPQIAWELACTGRKWADFVSFDPRIHEPSLRFFYRRTGRDELEWIISNPKETVTLKGEAVIDYFTSEVLKLNAEIEHFFAEWEIKPIAPFPVELIEAEPEQGATDYDPSKPFAEQNYDFLDKTGLKYVEAI
jgi:hypothetical protein